MLFHIRLAVLWQWYAATAVKFLHYKLVKFLSFHENEEPSRHFQIQDRASLLNVGRQGLILAMEGQICRKQLYQLLLDYYARKTFLLLYK